MSDLPDRIDTAIEGTTPGPWWTWRNYPNQHAILCEPQNARDASDGQVLANVLGDANAELIAAAPSLLAEARDRIRTLEAAITEHQRRVRDFTPGDHPHRDLWAVLDDRPVPLRCPYAPLPGPHQRVGRVVALHDLRNTTGEPDLTDTSALRALSHQIQELNERLAALEHSLAKVPTDHMDVARDVMLIRMWDRLRSKGERFEVSAQQLALIDQLRRYNGGTKR